MNIPPTQPLDARRFAGIMLAALALAAAALSALTRSDAAPASIAQRIDLNEADAARLTLLPNIGPARAAAIIADREANGPFHALEDLAEIPGLGPRTIEDLAPHADLRASSRRQRP